MGEDADIWPTPLHADLVAEFRRLSRRKTSQYAGAQLDSSAFAILLVLSDGQPRTLRELSVELELEQSTINRQVNGAIQRGYLERYEVAGQVSKLIRPTDTGRRAFHDDGMLRVDRLNRVFGDLAPGTPQALLRELRAYNDAYDRAVDRDG